MIVLLLLLTLSVVTFEQTNTTNTTALQIEMDTLTGWAYSFPDGRRVIKNINGDYNVYSYNPMPDGKVTTINLKILINTHFATIIGFASSQGRYNPCWVGCQIGTFGWYIRSDQGRYVNNLKIPYGRPIFVGDVITICLDLTTDAGTVTYFVNGQSQGAAFSGVRRWSPLYFGYISAYVNDAIEILGATVSDS